MHRPPLWLAALVLAAASCYAGEAHDVSPRRAAALEADPAWKFVRGVPFIPQRADSDCGPAALAMVLSHFGVKTSLEEVAGLSPPDKVGVRAGGLRDAARAKGMEAFVVEGNFNDLVDQLSRDRPVLVGLAKPITGGRALAHYEVVVGIDKTDRKIVTLDPSRGLRENTLEGFGKEWVPTGRVTLIVFPRPARAAPADTTPDAAPAAPDRRAAARGRRPAASAPRRCGPADPTARRRARCPRAA
ncbi:MAG TPA: cysteine peptidase family C39 domain-containing protein [Polyangia bacterium]|nr:cysteine peptidase family C39 domain-containing protein [Polyangia bacterium]